METKTTRIFADGRRKLREAVKALRDAKALGVDTETSSLDPHTSKLWSVQIGNEDTQVLIPVNDKSFDIGEFQDIFLDPSITKIMHRATFDLKILWRRGWDVAGVYCTRTMEQILTAGRFADTSLAGTLRRRFDVDMSKKERGDFYKAVDGKEADARGMVTIFENSGMKWTDDLIDYAIGDVEYLVPLMRQQVTELEATGMLRLAQKIELPLVYTVALMEYRGVCMDVEGCKLFQGEMAEKAAGMRKELSDKLNPLWQAHARPIFLKNYEIYRQWAEAHREIVTRTNKDRNPNNKKEISEAAKAERSEHEALRPFRTPPKEPKIINIGSTPQLTAALRQDNVYLKDMRKETLQEAATEHPLIADIVEFRKYDKLSQMAEIYERINKATKRLHGTFNQNVDTGRFSSREPNLQNIPARNDDGARFRQQFTASKGNVMIVADFSAIELVIIGVLSKDKNLLHALNNVEDLHCYTMGKFINCPYEALVATKDHNPEKGKEASQEDFDAVSKARAKFERAFTLPDLNKLPWDEAGLTKWVKTFRDYVKTLTYGIAYGLSSYGLSRRFHCDPDTAQQFIDTFFKVYPSIKRWLDKQSDFAMKTGYSKTVSGRRRYYKRVKPPSSNEVRAAVTKFFKEQDRELSSLTDKEYHAAWVDMKKKLSKEYFQAVNRIRRQAANQPIQGTSADITKYAMVLWEDWWADHCDEHGIDLFKTGIVLTVHDEIVLDVPKKHSKIALKMLKEFMEKAAKAFLGKSVKIVVEPHETPFWKK